MVRAHIYIYICVYFRALYRPRGPYDGIRAASACVPRGFDMCATLSHEHERERIWPMAARAPRRKRSIPDARVSPQRSVQMRLNFVDDKSRP